MLLGPGRHLLRMEEVLEGNGVWGPTVSLLFKGPDTNNLFVAIGALNPLSATITAYPTHGELLPRCTNHPDRSNGTPLHQPSRRHLRRWGSKRLLARGGHLANGVR